MNLYTYNFLNQNHSTMDYIFLFLVIGVGLIFAFSVYKYLKNRSDLKFRDLFILLSLVVAFIIGVQINNINSNSLSNSHEVAHLLKQISHDQNVSTNDIYADSTNLSDGMLIKVKNQYYTVQLDNKHTGYRLAETKSLASENINYITKNSISFNLADNNYVTLGLKLLIGFIMIVVQINLSGKSNLSQSTVIDQMQNYVLGGIIGGMIYSQTITILEFTLVLLLWSIIIFSSRFMSQNTKIFHHLLIGNPFTVIKNGKVDVAAILRAGMTADDLLFNLRTSGIHNIHDIDEAVFERNGSITVSDDDSQRVYSIIVDGNINDNELKAAHLNQTVLKEHLQINGQQYASDQIFLGQFQNGEFYLLPYPNQEQE
ncbi:DUF3290 family protein [Convivina praedatoris]|uniref:DUF421 domain-containing protein n=1 Tax=Convivina praedatoris TaxID=2880963 RepID=A0ABM9D2M8_9LACO|nr:DUF3290 family protein [Convivina sp. LMG 32447]CAH1851677.1 hypothetical protein R077815_00374 [Convivina sp. LMG 32447]CAH1853738.1 hypothetical protein LMG032447_00706 [Convivina sp. LMG 32447]CAH1854323.1 hypothetical protein R078138_00856 [Convivina sp. LMG 32447]